ncbi:GPW/gp25 family protein [Chryseobacterium wanjuense]
MDTPNYRMPFVPSTLMTEGGSIDTCDMGESIAHNIMLLITTKKGENRYDENYGNDVWNLEFDNGVTSAVWETVFIKSLKRQIQEYEPRIVQPQIDAHIQFVRAQLRHKRTHRNQKESKDRHQCKNGSHGRAFQLFYGIVFEPDVN